MSRKENTTWRWPFKSINGLITCIKSNLERIFFQSSKIAWKHTIAFKYFALSISLIVFFNNRVFCSQPSKQYQNRQEENFKAVRSGDRIIFKKIKSN